MQPAVETENLPEVPLQILDVIADPADPKLAKIGEILANLGGVQVKLLGQCLRGDGIDGGLFELGQAPQVDRQAIGRELGDLLVGGLPLVR